MLVNAILAYSTWGNLLDNLGNSHLKYVVGDDGLVRIFTARFTVDPVDGYPLTPITSENARDVNLLLHTKFMEVTDPKPDDFFGLNGRPMLYYSTRANGLHLFNLPVHDRASGQSLIPVSVDIESRWYKEHPTVPQVPMAKDQPSGVVQSTPTPTISILSAVPPLSRETLSSWSSPSPTPDQLDGIEILVSTPLEIVYEGKVVERMVFCREGPFTGLFHWKGDMDHFILTPPNGLLRNEETGNWEAPFQKFLAAHPDRADKLGAAYATNHPECARPFRLEFIKTAPHHHEGQNQGSGVFQDRTIHDDQGHTILLRRDPSGNVFVVHYDIGFDTRQIPDDVRPYVSNY
jgi:hypothetical protein